MIPLPAGLSVCVAEWQCGWKFRYLCISIFETFRMFRHFHRSILAQGRNAECSSDLGCLVSFSFIHSFILFFFVYLDDMVSSTCRWILRLRACPSTSLHGYLYWPLHHVHNARRVERPSIDYYIEGRDRINLLLHIEIRFLFIIMLQTTTVTPLRRLVDLQTS